MKNQDQLLMLFSLLSLCLHYGHVALTSLTKKDSFQCHENPLIPILLMMINQLLFISQPPCHGKTSNKEVCFCFWYGLVHHNKKSEPYAGWSWVRIFYCVLKYNYLFKKYQGGFSGNILLCLIRFIRFVLQTSNETMLQSFFNQTSTLPLTKKQNSTNIISNEVDGSGQS